MTEVVAIFGVLLAVYTYIDSLYRQSIMKALNEKRFPKARNNEALIGKLKYLRKCNAIPLLIFSCILFLLMLPDFLITLISSLENIFDNSSSHYSISSATIIIVPIIFFYWVVVNFNMVKAISKKIKKLSKDE